MHVLFSLSLFSYQSIDYRVPRSLEFAIITPSSTYRKLLHPLGATETDLKQQSLRLSEEDSVKRAEEKTLGKAMSVLCVPNNIEFFVFLPLPLSLSLCS